MEGEQQIQPAADKPKQGGSKLLLVIILILVLIGAGVAAYFIFVKKASDTGGGVLSSIIPKSLNATCKYNDPDLCKFINGWKEVKYMTMVSTDATNSMTFKMEGDDKSQVVMGESGSEKYNTITIGKTTYTKDYTDSKWFKYTASDSTDSIVSSQENQVDFDDKAEQAEDKTTYEKIGTEACGKLTCFKYKVIDPANTESTEYIYFDNKDYQLRKSRSEAKDGTVSEATYSYDKVSISEPSPVKEGNPYELPITPSTTTLPAATVTPETTAPAEVDYPLPSDDDVSTEAGE